MSPPKGLTSLFDLCIAPEHDLRSGSNVITTKGAMNMIEPANDKNQHSGLFLIGGPSQHHGWDESMLIKQIVQILDANSSIQWTLTSSRRTPPSTTAQLEKLSKEQVKVLPFEATDKDWLPRELSMSAHVWVTEDSVSMVYEALSSGAKVGLLPHSEKVHSLQSRVRLKVTQSRRLPNELPREPGRSSRIQKSSPFKRSRARRKNRRGAISLISHLTMKVIQILPELNSGGVERGTLEVGKYLVDQGHESIVISNGGRLVAQLEAEGSRHITLPVHKKRLSSLKQVKVLRRLLEQERPDILHLRSRLPAWLAYLAWRKMEPHHARGWPRPCTASTPLTPTLKS